jgi:hypothetical protein
VPGSGNPELITPFDQFKEPEKGLLQITVHGQRMLDAHPVTPIRYVYSYSYMARSQATRTFRCAYCGEKRTVPSTRGPAPSYCSVAHRQAAYRERRAAERAPGRSRVTLHDEIRSIRSALEEAADAKTWPAARRALAGIATSPERQEGKR